MEDLMQLDLYELLNISVNADEKEIKKAYRKRALSCHPDKNPDNPKAAELFLQLSKALKILADTAARSAYDKVLNARKAAKVRHRELDSKRKKLKEDLETREKLSQDIREKAADSAESLRKEIFLSFHCKIMDELDGRRVAYNNIYGDTNKNIELLVFKVQKDFCEEIKKFEGSKEFKVNRWSTESGAGITQFLEEGEVFEKVGVCASVSYGMLPPSAFVLLSERNAVLNPPEKSNFYAVGISAVVYPKNPHVPTLNFSYRYFEIIDEEDKIWWFTGGTDLIPYILNVDDCHHFHKILKSCCDLYDKSSYRTFKKCCDEYFYLDHRGERRGIGGIFFNKLNFPNKEKCFQFVKSCMDKIIPSYIPIVLKNKKKKFSFDDREWQLLQRGRSVEFNLICDKGTELALLTPGVQYENVLIFLPPEVKWQYDYTPEKNSKKSELLEILHNPRDWV